MLNILLSSPLAFAVLAVALMLSIAIHEFAHAWTADHLGDPTPHSQGRVTLNPLAHLDPIGTIAIVLTGFGWGKSVMFDPYNLANPRRDIVLIALAGPVSNILLATALAILTPWLPLPAIFVQVMIYINLVLAIFNLVPIHPLDGGKILSGFLPPHLAAEYDAVLHQYGMWILLALVFPWIGNQSAISYLLGPALQFAEFLLWQLAGIIHQVLL